MEEIKVQGRNLKTRLEELLREGNIRRVVLKNPQGRTLIDIPLTAGLAGIVLLPLWAAVATVAAVAADFTIAVERDPGGSLSRTEPGDPPGA
ncbi:MAG: DUF4342 domain-containing protein [Gemmatimonadota bacterium]